MKILRPRRYGKTRAYAGPEWRWRQTQMQNCHRLRELKESAATASRRSRCLLDVSARLRAVTGFSSETVLELISRTVEARKRACAALVGHASLHGCASANCNWPAPACHACEREKPMSEEKRELLEKLKFELAFVEDGGYGRSVRAPHKPTSPFQDSLTCLNFGDPSRRHPCAECILMQYVPESRKHEDVPCHHIPLDQERRTIATLEGAEAEEVLRRWLRDEISRLEGELAP